MQTFLPVADFAGSAACLDDRRLGKQRLEVLQLLRCLLGLMRAWRSHPAARMWDGYESSLADYGVAVCTEWMRRDFEDALAVRIVALRPGPSPPPPWLGGRIHATHRSNLLRKDVAHYSRFGWSEPNNLPYFWPVS